MAGRQYAVIGLGEFGMSVALSLTELGGEVMAIDKNPQLVEEIKDEVMSSVCVDVKDERSLEETGVGDVDVAIVGVGDDLETAIVVTVLLKRLGVPEVVVKASSALHAHILKLVGATRIVDPEKEMGKRIAMEVWAPDVNARIRLSTGQEVLEVAAPQSFWGKTIKQLSFRNTFGLNIIAIKNKVVQTTKKGEVVEKWQTNQKPTADDVIAQGDVIVAVGDAKNIKAFLGKIR